jgi:hypothetical protein
VPALQQRYHRREENTPPTPIRGKGTRRKPREEEDSAFTTFFTAYPRKVGRAAALKAWSQLNPDAALVARIIDALGWQKDSPEWLKDDGKYIPHPANWIEGRRWEDERPAAMTQPTEDLDEIQRRQRERNAALKAEQEAARRSGGTL